ncbi:Uncharacterised protein [Streptococcus acidominimus]|uniref:Uncharacterized protein n=2 Tax=Streptococcus TaxID=1301 RepID=A0A239XPU0_STRAI|nr:Uncharacterised protein [Streptococcus acidominimus]
MVKRDITDNYEELLNYTEEIRESVNIIHDWLKKKPNFDDHWSYHDLIALHGQHFALLNLIMYRMDDLITEHRKIIEEIIQGRD